MRNISFQLTTRQFQARTKTVTRRLKWLFVKAGDMLQGCEKCMGIKKGEIRRLSPIRVLSVRREPLNAITQDDVVREGFPEMTPGQFVAMFCRHMNCAPTTEVTRIEFEFCDGLKTMEVDNG